MTITTGQEEGVVETAIREQQEPHIIVMDEISSTPEGPLCEGNVVVEANDATTSEESNQPNRVKNNDDSIVPFQNRNDGDDESVIVVEQSSATTSSSDNDNVVLLPIEIHSKPAYNDKEQQQQQLTRKRGLLQLQQCHDLSPRPKIRKKRNPQHTRCGTCFTCSKKECGICWACRRRQQPQYCAAKNDRTPVCFQKICCNLDEQNRRHPIYGYFPGWTFLFDDPSKCSHNALGLAIFSPKKQIFWSMEELQAVINKGASTVCSCLGVHPQDFVMKVPMTTIIGNESGHEQHQQQLLPQEKRILSSTKELGSRIYCRWPVNGTFYWGTITKVMTKRRTNIPHYSIEFDDGDIVEDTTEREKGMSLNMYSESEYYASTGMLPPLPPAFCIDESFSPAQLFENRCSTCSLCQAENCGRCDTCRSGVQICLRKMCMNIPLKKKAQAAAGLEPGWRFVFCEAKQQEKDLAVDSLCGLRLLSPNGRSFKSLEDVLKVCGQKWPDWDGIRNGFYRQIGSYILRKEDHFLVGKRYCQEWTDVEGQNKIVYGTVVGCERNDMDNSFYNFTVVFDDLSRTLADSVRNNCGSHIPEQTTLSLPWALGGCIKYDMVLNTGLGNVSVFHGMDNAVISKYWSWITPEMRIEKLLPTVDGSLLPCLIVTVRGFQLTFSVKKSGITNAGYGVFVKCASFAGADAFVLAPGEIFDIGVYAPFRKEDRKHAAVFLLKNYIHNLKCEEWSFDTTDSTFQFDITDDETGNLHELASSHIPAYVNECGPDSIATVKAEHDPEGNVHYLLGVADGSASLSLAADDSEHEIFINYGPVYEHVRVRKGYSTLPPDELNKQLQKDEDAEYIGEILEMEKDDVNEALGFIRSLVPQGEQVSADKRLLLRKALTVTALLQRRAKACADAYLETQANDLLSTLLNLNMDCGLAKLQQSSTFCYEIVKNQLDGNVSEALKRILSKLE